MGDRPKILYSLVASGAFAAGIAGVWLWAHCAAEKALNEQAMEDLHYAVREVADRAQAAIVFEDGDRATEHLKSFLLVRPQISKACVYMDDPFKPRKLAEYSRDNNPNASCPDTAPVEASGFSQDRFVISHPVASKDNKIGTFYIEVAKSDMDARARGIMRKVF